MYVPLVRGRTHKRQCLRHPRGEVSTMSPDLQGSTHGRKSADRRLAQTPASGSLRFRRTVSFWFRSARSILSCAMPFHHGVYSRGDLQFITASTYRRTNSLRDRRLPKAGVCASRGWRIHRFSMYVPLVRGRRHKRRCLRHPRGKVSTTSPDLQGSSHGQKSADRGYEL
jgi:hypothetical protein